MASMAAPQRPARGTPRGSHLSPAARKALLTAHLTTAVSLIGVAAVIVTLAVTGLRGADPATVYPALYTVSWAILAPLFVLALAIGITQALLGGWGLLRHGWVVTKLVITTVLCAAVLAGVVPALRRVADDAASGAELTTAQQVVPVVTPATAVVLMLLAATLGVVKPGRRRPG